MIAANSMHKVAGDVAAAISIPILHIVDETGEKMKADGVKAAAVIGTRGVMTEPWFRQRLVGHGLTLAPYDASRAARCFAAARSNASGRRIDRKSTRLNSSH